jgi:hypothetical protein
MHSTFAGHHSRVLAGGRTGPYRVMRGQTVSRFECQWHNLTARLAHVLSLYITALSSCTTHFTFKILWFLVT